ncbi:PKD domain-containing protein [Halorussus sp. MSC15.2]|uniref:PKD domain-containing protein n=1 Tax=Halorussus sp. MSC15.2 TaxID=2283638 RepID=UPI002814A8EC|nr:PKD domain-containing protein [Halorussus sp. MSC15.2]
MARYEWDFTGDGTADATGQFANHTYEESGKKRATLRAVGADGRTDTMTRAVRVRPTLDA